MQSFKVRFWKTETYVGKRVTTYYVRWTVDGRAFREPFRQAEQAKSFLSKLRTAAREGEAFDTRTGRPVSWERETAGPSWYTFACEYAAAKWPNALPNHRRSIAEALTDATEALLTSDKGRPDAAELRAALRSWAFSARAKDVARDVETPVPDEHRVADAWLKGHTINMSEFQQDGRGGALAHAVLNRIGRKLDGKRAAGNTTNRKRMVINNAFNYARETGVLKVNPFEKVTWTRPRTNQEVDPAAVPNPDQARALLDAVASQGEFGERLRAFFGCMYYAGLRPEEVISLGRSNLTHLPPEGWGQFVLTAVDPEAGTRWTDDGGARQAQPLKHRAEGVKRPVPIHPELVELLHVHIAKFGYGTNGRLFTGPRGGIIRDSTYLPIWHEARRRALTADEVASDLARVPYDLRHACLSTWLVSTSDSAQVAQWAGHSVAMLHRVYARCIAGREEEAKRRIMDATARRTDSPETR